ncbi:sigma-70 family RNA polymerase sigma factor [Gemmata obscuriglobus]|uniref:RNA polymerase subunit sigma-24 n=1 Tax=Gemmata obscuriglobus TaxID=114 RepID=A0A2Z3HM14_9BACT|nr:sigma-70 family RNA polymerase sigma factor [Gemmata obscuriglobus]AWM42530.1 RNA polymerase subunit sigma-24 [Gemmata obscuriglobus]
MKFGYAGSGSVQTDQAIRDARAGDREALGGLFDRYVNYLTLLARVQIGRRLQGKLDPADAVQEAFLQAHRHFSNFRGSTEAELAAWLRRILACVLSNTVQHYLGTQARDPRLEQVIAADVDRSSAALVGRLAAPGPSPSEAACRHERAVLVADALARLPDDYREVVLLRFAEGLAFAEVAARMGRSVDSVEKLWVRGVVRLRQLIGGP